MFSYSLKYNFIKLFEFIVPLYTEAGFPYSNNQNLIEKMHKIIGYLLRLWLLDIYHSLELFFKFVHIWAEECDSYDSRLHSLSRIIDQRT